MDLKVINLLVMILSSMCVELSKGRSYQVALGCKRHHKDNCLVDEYCDIMQQVCKPCEGLCREYKDACKQQCPRQYEIQYVRKPTTTEVDTSAVTQLGNMTAASRSNDENGSNISPFIKTTVAFVVAFVILITLIGILSWKLREQNKRINKQNTANSQAQSYTRLPTNDDSRYVANVNPAASSIFREAQEVTTTV